MELMDMARRRQKQTNPIFQRNQDDQIQIINKYNNKIKTGSFAAMNNETIGKFSYFSL